MKDGRDRKVCVLSEEFHGGNLRFCFDSGHESPCDPCDEFNSIDEGYEVGLETNINDRHLDGDQRIWVPCGKCLR